jgi:hypothetical protein
MLVCGHPPELDVTAMNAAIVSKTNWLSVM